MGLITAIVDKVGAFIDRLTGVEAAILNVALKGAVRDLAPAATDALARAFLGGLKK